MELKTAPKSRRSVQARLAPRLHASVVRLSEACAQVALQVAHVLAARHGQFTTSATLALNRFTQHAVLPPRRTVYSLKMLALRPTGAALSSHGKAPLCAVFGRGTRTALFAAARRRRLPAPRRTRRFSLKLQHAQFVATASVRELVAARRQGLDGSQCLGRHRCTFCASVTGARALRACTRGRHTVSKSAAFVSDRTLQRRVVRAARFRLRRSKLL